MIQFDIVSCYPCFSSTFACFLLFLLHNLSFQFYDYRDRNHPTTLKKRMCSNIVVMIISLLIMKTFLFMEELNHHGLFELLGFRQPGLLNASILPLINTMIFLLGPLCMEALLSLWKSCSKQGFLMSKVCNIIFMSKVIVIPFYEEFIFRACMMLLLLQCYKLTTAIFINGLIFAYIHTGIILERIKKDTLLEDIIYAIFVLAYYFFVGAYLALIFVKTGHIAATYFPHAFLNIISPDFTMILYYETSKKIFYVILCLSGIVLGYSLLTPLTNHLLYDNNFHLK